MKRVHLRFLAAMVMAFTLAACLWGCASKGGDGSGGDAADPGQGGSGGGTVEPDQGGSADPGQDGTVVLDGDICVVVALDYNAGTGFTWNCSVEPEGVMSIGTQDTVDLAEDELLSGGPLQDVVTLWADAPGKATLTCTLERDWEEGEPAETQTYVFEVDDALQISFLADESNYLNEPEIVSGS